MVEVMLDSGSSVSLVRHDIAKRLKGTTSPGDAPKIRLISAGGEEITIVNHIKASVEIRGIDKVRRAAKSQPGPGANFFLGPQLIKH